MATGTAAVAAAHFVTYGALLVMKFAAFEPVVFVDRETQGKRAVNSWRHQSMTHTKVNPRSTRWTECVRAVNTPAHPQGRTARDLQSCISQNFPQQGMATICRT
jgi:ribosomal protein L24E